MRVVEVTWPQKRAAELLIKMKTEDGEPVDEWTRQVAAAEPRPPVVDPALLASDEIVPYLV